MYVCMYVCICSFYKSLSVLLGVEHFLALVPLRTLTPVFRVAPEKVFH